LHGTKINNLKFVDDVNLLVTNNKGLQQQLGRLFIDSERYAMYINEGQTKTMVFEKTPEENDAEVYVDGKQQDR